MEQDACALPCSAGELPLLGTEALHCPSWTLLSLIAAKEG